MILRNLRPAGSKEYVIPKGFAFNYITCANYTFEIYGWILFGVATQTVAAFMFVAAGSFPMSQWAIGKHKRLRKVTCLPCMTQYIAWVCPLLLLLFGCCSKVEYLEQRRVAWCCRSLMAQMGNRSIPSAGWCSHHFYSVKIQGLLGVQQFTV